MKLLGNKVANWILTVSDKIFGTYTRKITEEEAEFYMAKMENRASCIKIKDFGTAKPKDMEVRKMGESEVYPKDQHYTIYFPMYKTRTLIIDGKEKEVHLTKWEKFKKTGPKKKDIKVAEAIGYIKENGERVFLEKKQVSYSEEKEESQEEKEQKAKRIKDWISENPERWKNLLQKAEEYSVKDSPSFNSNTQLVRNTIVKARARSDVAIILGI